MIDFYGYKPKHLTVDNLKFLPQRPGIYFLGNELQVTYIGQSSNLHQRLVSSGHHVGIVLSKQLGLKFVVWIETEEYLKCNFSHLPTCQTLQPLLNFLSNTSKDRQEIDRIRLDLERKFIRQVKPCFNKACVPKMKSLAQG